MLEEDSARLAGDVLSMRERYSDDAVTAELLSAKPQRETHAAVFICLQKSLV